MHCYLQLLRGRGCWKQRRRLKGCLLQEMCQLLRELMTMIRIHIDLPCSNHCSSTGPHTSTSSSAISKLSHVSSIQAEPTTAPSTMDALIK